jgi:hypothetical protein
MFRHLKQAWDFLRAERIETHDIESVAGMGFCEVRLHRKKDGTCWVTLVARGGEAIVYVPFEPDQAADLARRLEIVADTARRMSRTRPR